MDLEKIAKFASWKLRSKESIDKNPSPYEGFAIKYLTEKFKYDERVFLFGDGDPYEVYIGMRFFAYIIYLESVAKMDLSRYRPEDHDRAIMSYYKEVLKTVCINLRERQLAKHKDCVAHRISLDDFDIPEEEALCHEYNFEEDVESYAKVNNYVGVRQGIKLKRIEQSQVLRIPQIKRNGSLIEQQGAYFLYYSVPFTIIQPGDEVLFKFKRDVPLNDGLFKISSVNIENPYKVFRT